MLRRWVFSVIVSARCKPFRLPALWHSTCRHFYTSTVNEKSKTAAKIQNLPLATYDVITIPGDKKDISIPLPKTYSSKFTEAAWYDWWVKQGYFQPSKNEEKFVMLLPPPNVTGKLHIGHAFTGAIQDALVRWNRMRGLSTLWIPGSDHAGIATQVMVEKQLWRDEMLTRHDIGKEAFLQLVWKWKENKAEQIDSQLKRMGLSLDWSRQYFTLSDQMKAAVNSAFCQLYDQGLISRNVKMVNWSCQLKSTIADIEVDNVHIDGPTPFTVPGYRQDVVLGYLTSFAYPIHNSEKNEEIVVATTRLETMLGDTAIAVHPSDSRYSHLIGKYAKHPYAGRLLPIIADDFVQPDIGSGAVKITPSHSVTDHEIAQKHKLSYWDILSDDGLIINSSEPFNGMKRFDAREKVAQFLQRDGLWRGQVSHAMAVPICSRSSDIIEPRLKEQWFLDCSNMAKKAIKAAEDGSLKFIPAYYEKIWKNFLEQSHQMPWCISRQLWWGHKIPAYNVLDCQNSSYCWVVAPTYEDAERSAKDLLGHSNFKLRQDEDVLDTWFSAALLPFASLGWPMRGSYEEFYPGSMIESGSDILFFWIARMVMLGQQLTNQLPFNQVLIHSLLLSQGKKMSKSKGNVIDPMSVINGCTIFELEKSLEESNIDRKEMMSSLSEQKKLFPEGFPECGADSLRMALCSYNFKGEAVNIEMDTFVQYRSLCNKIWQVHKYYSQHWSADFIPTPIHKMEKMNCLDRWILDRCSNLVALCDTHFSSADLDVIAKSIKTFYTSELSKVYLECSKNTLHNGTATEKHNAISIALDVLYCGLRCLSPFMPFLSEELYQRLPLSQKSESICIAQFPSCSEWDRFRDKDLEKHFSLMLEISSFINLFKTNLGFHHQSLKVGTVYIETSPTKSIPPEILKHIATLSRLKNIHINQMPDNQDCVCPLEMEHLACNLFIDVTENLQDSTEVEKMVARIQKIIKTQTWLLDEALHKDVNQLKDPEQKKHFQKIEALKSELAMAEVCVNYLLKHL